MDVTGCVSLDCSHVTSITSLLSFTIASTLIKHEGIPRIRDSNILTVAKTITNVYNKRGASFAHYLISNFILLSNLAFILML